MQNRNQVIVRTSMIGILANVFLAAFKAAVGLLSHSIAVVLDAVNNLSDAFSSVVTIIGTKLAGRMPDKKHPLGHGRLEYISAMAVSAIILYAGFTSLTESIKKIIHPEKADYSPVSLLIIALAIVVKLLLGRFVKRRGEAVNSAALMASGSDATFDAILSASVLACAMIDLAFGISLEAYVGVAISVVIIKAGYEMMSDTVDDILGKRPDPQVSRQIRQLLSEEPQVRGAYDLILNNYGPNKNYGSVHLELPDTMTVEEVDRLTRKLEAKVYYETGVILTGVGVYSYNTSNEAVSKIRNDIQERILGHDWALQMHGFYLDVDKKTIRMDVVMSFDIDPMEGIRTLLEELNRAYPDYEIRIQPDVDLAD